MDSTALLAFEFFVEFLPLFIIFMIYKIKQSKSGFKFTKYHWFTIAMFSLYIACVYYFTDTGTMYDIVYEHYTDMKYQINIIPFSKEINIVYYVLNVFLFVPFGVLAPIIWKKMDNIKNIVSVSFMFTLIIELSQLLNRRSTDIDDIILNVFGAVIGYCLFKLWDKLTKSQFQVNSPFVIEMIVCIIVIFVARFFLFDEGIYSLIFLGIEYIPY